MLALGVILFIVGAAWAMFWKKGWIGVIILVIGLFIFFNALFSRPLKAEEIMPSRERTEKVEGEIWG